MTLPGLSLILAIAVFVVVWLALFVAIVFFPSSWSERIDRIHEFFVSRRLLSASISQQIKVLEKGFVLPMVVAATILVASMDLTVLILRLVLGVRI